MSEIELILTKLKIVSEEQEQGMYLCDKEHSKLLLDYITNLQEKYEEADNDRYKLFEQKEKAIEFIKEKISSTQGVINDYMYHKEHNKRLIELLQEDIEMYKKELHILNGGDE